MNTLTNHEYLKFDRLDLKLLMTDACDSISLTISLISYSVTLQPHETSNIELI